MPGAKPVNIAALRARLWASRGDVKSLQALRSELGASSGSGVAALLREIDNNIAVQQIKPQQKAPVTHEPLPVTLPNHQETTDLVEKIRLRAKASDQPLYCYNVSDDEFGALRERLSYLHKRGALDQPNERTSATFVLYFAEWFRREYAGGGYSWDAPFPVGLSHQARGELAVSGLRWWGRKPKRSSRGELRLMSLALEGGFPTRLLESRENGRITQHLKRLAANAAAIADPAEELLESISRSMGASLGTYDHLEFHALCAELIRAILGLKAKASELAPAGVPAIAWLDGARPNWRDELPIGLPGERSRLLLDDLVNSASGRLGDDSAGVTRQLLLRDGRWSPSALIRMSGEIDLRRTSFRPDDGRLRVRACGLLADIVAGDMGLIEPPTDDDQHWCCRVRGGRDFDVPFRLDVDVELELRSGGKAESHPWPGGSAIRSKLVVFAEDQVLAKTGSPTRLVFVGQGSVRTRRQRVFCLVPATFRAEEATTGCPVQPFWRGPDFLLFETSSATHFRSIDGDVFRVEANTADESAEHLAVEGAGFSDAEPANTAAQIFQGAPRFWIRGGGRAKTPPTDEIFWKQTGTQNLLRFQGAIGKWGSIDVIWKDAVSGVTRDRATVILLPPTLSLRCVSAGGFRCRILLEGAPGWEVLAGDDSLTVRKTSAQQIEVEWPGQPRRQIPLKLFMPDGEAVSLLIQPRYSNAAFFSAAGLPLDDRVRIMIDDLSGATAFGEGNERLYLTGPAGGQRRIAFRDEASLWGLSEDVERLLSASDNLDDEVLVEYGRSSLPRLRIARYSATLATRPDGVVLVSSGGAPPGQGLTRRLDWFSILFPEFHELAVGREFARMPGELVGPGVAVLREGRRIIGRPTFLNGGDVDEGMLTCRLQRACAAPTAVRRELIDRAISGLADEDKEADADLQYLHKLVAALDGIPPSALDPIKSAIGNAVARAAWLTSAASEEQRAAIWKLERDLPFLWCATPLLAFQKGFARQANSLTGQMLTLGIEPQMAQGIAESSVRSAAADLSNLDAGLRMVMAFCGLTIATGGAPPTIFKAAQSIVARADIADDDPRFSANAEPSRASCFRTVGVATALPDFTRFPSLYWQSLDAPCACALSAAGLMVLTKDQVIAARAIKAEEPIVFYDMYAGALSVLAKGAQLSCEP